MSDTLPTIATDRLTVGLYVHLDLGWMDHPFTFNNFKIHSREQIDIIRSLGLKQVRYDPGRSDVAPPAAPTQTSQAAAPAPVASQATLQIQEAKRRRVEENRRLREKIAACEKDFVKAASVVRNISRNLLSNPKGAIEEARQLTDQLVESLLADRDVAIHLMNDKIAGEEVYYHVLNVAMLAAMLGKGMGMDAATVKVVSLGALFHDIGKLDIPDKILLKKEQLTQAELNFLRQHCAYGVELGKRVGLPAEVITVIAQHHEAIDGSGYPAGLTGDRISLAARVVAVVNAYDNLCNPVNIAAAMTPHEALSLMFAKQRAQHDALALRKLVHMLGVYPPGSVVRLSNDMTGMVLSVNTAKPLRPLVMVYDAAVPRHEAISIDLEGEPEINISKSLRPAQLPRQVFEYLSPRRRTTYYFDAAEGGAPPGA
jgi:putative nucleotidyltransferase with HDIG domain